MRRSRGPTPCSARGRPTARRRVPSRRRRERRPPRRGRRRRARPRVGAPRAEHHEVRVPGRERDDVSVDPVRRARPRCRGAPGSSALGRARRRRRPRGRRRAVRGTRSVEPASSAGGVSAPRASSRLTASRTCSSREPWQRWRVARDLVDPHGADGRGAAGLPPGPGTEVGRGHGADALGGHGLAPAGSTLHGSMRRSAQDATSGSATSSCTQPSSCSQRRCSTEPFMLR